MANKKAAEDFEEFKNSEEYKFYMELLEENPNIKGIIIRGYSLDIHLCRDEKENREEYINAYYKKYLDKRPKSEEALNDLKMKILLASV